MSHISLCCHLDLGSLIQLEDQVLMLWVTREERDAEDKDISKEKDTTRSKVVIQDKKNDAKDSKKRRKKLFGLTKSQLKMVGMEAFICLILYIVLLILTEKAASCSGTIQQYLRERQKFLDQISN